MHLYSLWLGCPFEQAWGCAWPANACAQKTVREAASSCHRPDHCFYVDINAFCCKLICNQVIRQPVQLLLLRPERTSALGVAAFLALGVAAFLVGFAFALGVVAFFAAALGLAAAGVFAIVICLLFLCRSAERC